MKFLLAIGSCNRYELNGWNDGPRTTCFADAVRMGMDCKFFHGDRLVKEPQECVRRDDIVVLPADDSYGGGMFKAREMYKWMLDRDYDYIYRCDHDTYFRPERLLTSGFEKYDLLGCLGYGDGPPKGRSARRNRVLRESQGVPIVCGPHN